MCLCLQEDDLDDNLAVWLAAGFGRLHEVQRLLEQGQCIPNWCTWQTRQTALERAALYNYDSVCNLLRQYGWNLDARKEPLPRLSYYKVHTLSYYTIFYITLILTTL